MAEKSQEKKNQTGFTVMELLVLAAIMIIVSGIVLRSFAGSRERAVHNQVRKLALALRQAQNTTLAVKQIGGAVPKAVGVRLSTDTALKDQYTLFADLNDPIPGPPPEGNGIFDSPPDLVIQEYQFPQRVYISKMTSSGSVIQDVAHVLFTAPEATLSLTDETGASLGITLEIELSSATAQIKRRILVSISGHISIR